MEITRDVFDSRSLDTFWRFIAERQRVWVRRVKLGKPPPWTKDPILQKEHFTNVYRELDPGTLFLFKHFLNNPRLDREEKAWHILNYRLTGSNRFVYRSVFPVHLHRWDPERYRELMHNAADTGVKVWGTAYTVTGAVCSKGESKIDAIARVIDQYTFNWSHHWSAGEGKTPPIDNDEGSHQSFKAINAIYGFGAFTAYQTLIDMMYEAENGSQVLPWDPNDWATLGLGAKEGIKRLLAEPSPPLDVLRWLVANQRKEFKRVGERFPYLRNQDDSKRLLNLQTFQTCLCEFWKYARIKFDGQRAQRIFCPKT